MSLTTLISTIYPPFNGDTHPPPPPLRRHFRGGEQSPFINRPTQPEYPMHIWLGSSSQERSNQALRPSRLVGSTLSSMVCPTSRLKPQLTYVSRWFAVYWDRLARGYERTPSYDQRTFKHITWNIYRRKRMIKCSCSFNVVISIIISRRASLSRPRLQRFRLVNAQDIRCNRSPSWPVTYQTNLTRPQPCCCFLRVEKTAMD